MLIDALMGASLVVVLGVLAHGSMQMGLIDDQNLVQTFFAHGAHPSFGVGISPFLRRAYPQKTSSWRNPGLGRLAIVVMDDPAQYISTLDAAFSFW